MEILIAMNSFKGSLSAIDASEIVEKAALELGFNKTRIFKVPIVDGGTDSLEVWSNFLDLEPIAINTVNPLGKPITTTILFNKDSGTAYIEMAKASGVHLIKPTPKSIFEATSYGTGVLIRKAIEKGARDIFLGIGGSATHDLGTGILRSLGVKFLDENDKELKTPSQLLKLKKIDHSSLDTLPDNLKITFLCDVNNKLLGKNGAAYTYAKQKGAETQYLIQKCEELSNIFYNYFNEEKNIEIGNKPGDGAAGGLPSIIRVLIHSELKSGANFTFDIAGIDQILNKVQLVITGEGSFDKQSFFGKGPGLLLDKARKLNKYSIVLCGKISPDVYIKDQQNVSFLSINNSSEEIKIAIKNTDRNLYSSAKSVLKVLKLGLKYQKQLN